MPDFENNDTKKGAKIFKTKWVGKWKVLNLQPEKQ